MAQFHDSFDATAALVTSLAVPHPGSAAQAPSAPVRARALTALREAEVELYCSHDSAAMHALRRAQDALVDAQGAAPQALGAVHEARWLILHHRGSEALQAIGQARAGF